MPLVEVVPHPRTNAGAIKTAMEFYKSLGKSPVHIRQETPGFVANRLQAALVNEAYSLVQRGIISAEACGMHSLIWPITKVYTNASYKILVLQPVLDSDGHLPAPS